MLLPLSKCSLGPESATVTIMLQSRREYMNIPTFNKRRCKIQEPTIKETMLVSALCPLGEHAIPVTSKNSSCGKSLSKCALGASFRYEAGLSNFRKCVFMSREGSQLEQAEKKKKLFILKESGLKMPPLEAERELTVMAKVCIILWRHLFAVCMFICLTFLMRTSGINVYVFSCLKETGYLKMGLKTPLLIKEQSVIKDTNTI